MIGATAIEAEDNSNTYFRHVYVHLLVQHM